MGLITQTARQYYTLTQKFTGTGSLSTFTLTFDPLPSSINDFIVFISGDEIDDSNYTYNNSTGVIDFTPSTPPALNVEVKVVLKNQKHGSYRYISLEDIINNFMVSYVGDDKIISTVKKLDVIFHAKQLFKNLAMIFQELKKYKK